MNREKPDHWPTRAEAEWDEAGRRPPPPPSPARALWDARTDPWSVYYDPSWVGTEPPK